MAGDGHAIGQRVGIGPRHVVEAPAVGPGEASVGRHAPVGTLAGGGAGRQQVHADVGLGQVVLRGHAGLEQQPRPGALGHHHVAYAHPHVLGPLADVDALVGITRKVADPLVLLEPGVDGVTVEGDVAGKGGHRLQRLGVAPHRVLGGAVTDGDRPVGRLALERTRRVPPGGREQVGADVVEREVPHRGQTRLVQQLGLPAVGHRLAGEHGPHPLG